MIAYGIDLDLGGGVDVQAAADEEVEIEELFQHSFKEFQSPYIMVVKLAI